MAKTLGGFRTAVLVGWVALIAAGLLYAREKSIPAWAAVPVVAAFLLEYVFYLAAGFEVIRERLAGSRLPWLLTLSAIVPYLIYSIGTGQLQWTALAKLAGLALVLSFWYVVLPASPATDLAYLAVIAVVLLRRYFNAIYTPAVPPLEDVKVLGQLALIHISAFALLAQRHTPGTGFGFLPNRREWRAGVLHFLYFLPVGFPLALLLKAFQLGPIQPVWKIAATFIGILWVVALSEELFFRGLLQQWMAAWLRNRHAALLVTSVLFGMVHVGFRGFPNWRFVIVAAVAGWFYGRAFEQAKSIRASMVTHALVVTTWRAMFI